MCLLFVGVSSCKPVKHRCSLSLLACCHDDVIMVLTHRVDCRHIHSRPGLPVQEVEQRPRSDTLEAEQSLVLLKASHKRPMCVHSGCKVGNHERKWGKRGTGAQTFQSIPTSNGTFGNSVPRAAANHTNTTSKRGTNEAQIRGLR